MRVTISGRELKSVFIDIGGLLKRYDHARVIGIETTKNTVTFTVDTGIVYTRTVEVTPVADAINMSLTVLYTDISHFISAKEDINMDMTQFYVAFTTSKSVLTLTVGDSVVPPYVPRGGRIVDLDYGRLRKTVGVFAATRDLQKAFNKDFAINFYGDWALMKTPTVWIRTRAQGLYCTLSIDQARSITTYQPEFVKVSDRLEFHKESAILSVPCITPIETDKFPEHTKGMKLSAVINMKGVLKELNEVKKAIGVAEAEIHLHENGFNLSVSKGGIRLDETYNVTGISTYSFKYMLDIFIMCLALIGEDEEIRVSVKGDLVCLEGQDTSILLRV